MKHLRVKFSAFLSHLIFSLLLIGLFMAIVRISWFPGVTFELEDVWQGLKILIPVDAILGPVLTFILFVPGKKGLKLDLSVIVILQVAALIYGGYAIYDSRPAAYVFTGDRFEIVPAKSIDLSALEQSKVDQSSGFPLSVYALPAQTPEEQKAFILNNVQYQLMPERYRELSAFSDVVLKKAIPIEWLAPKTDSSVSALEQFKQNHNPSEVALFILQSTTSYAYLIIMNRETLNLEGYLAVDPWTEIEIPQN